MMTLKMTTLINEQLTWYLNDRLEKRTAYEAVKAEALQKGEDAGRADFEIFLLDESIRPLTSVTKTLADAIAIAEAERVDADEEMPIGMSLRMAVTMDVQLGKLHGDLQRKTEDARQALQKNNTDNNSKALKELEARTIEVYSLLTKLNNMTIL